MFGFMLFMILAFLIVLIWLARTPRGTRQRDISLVILFLTLIDVSTVAFWHVRTRMYTDRRQAFIRGNFDTPADHLIGLRDPKVNFHANHLLQLHQTRALTNVGLPVESLPRFALFRSAHVYKGIPGTSDFNLATGADGGGRSLAFPEEAKQVNVFKPFFDTTVTGLQGSVGEVGHVKVKGLSYNSFNLAVSSTQAALLFVRDAYSPYWTATVNGIKSPLTRVLGNFKAVVVPPGESEISLRFYPPGVGWALLIAYMVITGTALACLVSFYKLQRNRH
jgi:hypothetical protein